MSAEKVTFPSGPTGTLSRSVTARFLRCAGSIEKWAVPTIFS